MREREPLSKMMLMSGWDTSGLIVVALLVGVVLIVSAVAWRRQAAPEPDRPTCREDWQQQAADVCASGHAVVDRTSALQTGGTEFSLSTQQLRDVESQLEELVVRISSMRSTAPSQQLGDKMSLAATHADALKETLRTARRIQLSSSTSTGITLESLSLELASGRSGLDDALDEISSTLGEL